MRKIGLLIGILFLTIVSAFAQQIKEIDGIYYKGNTPYTGTYTVNFDNGNPKIVMNLVDGMKEGETKVYFQNRELNEIRSYRKNAMDGIWVTYNENKVKVAEARYHNGKKDGKWYIWDDNGTLIYELEYTEGEKTGIWKNYDKNGNVISERNYYVR
jgi:antitoxin component YwqK of YwqJK toxin-antitoxin module